MQPNKTGPKNQGRQDVHLEIDPGDLNMLHMIKIKTGVNVNAQIRDAVQLYLTLTADMDFWSGWLEAGRAKLKEIKSLDLRPGQQV